MFKRIRQALRRWFKPLSTYDRLIEGSFYDLYQSVPVGFVLNDIDTGRFLRVNPAFCDIVGYTEEELLNMTYWDITPPKYARDEHEQLMKLKNGSVYGPYEKEYYHKDGYEVPVWLSGMVMGDNHNVIWSLVQDITEQKETEDVIYKLAYYDPTTLLPNRAYFMERAAKVLRNVKAAESQCAFLLLDVDNFKRINDQMGYVVGDNLLREIAKQMTSCVEHMCNQTGCSDTFCARLGGDEFIILVDNIRDMDHVVELAKHLISHFSDTIDVDGRQLNVTASVGVSVFPADGEDASSLMKAADLALYSAKQHGKNQFFIHTADITTRFDLFHKYESILRYFVETHDFEIHFQPIYDLRQECPIGTEALFRGNEEKFGKLDLGFLIEVAEETGLIVPLGSAIFQRACERCSTCTLMGQDRQVSINVSVRQIEQPDFVEMICTTMRLTGVEPKNIAIEVTESVIMKEGDDIVHKLKVLENIGVSIFIDDFGKGYSSMTYLRHLPADKLKIDMEFIRDIEHDSTALEIIRGINNLAHSLDLITCAEGVETAQQKKMLSHIGVDQIQGYYIGKPMPFEELKEWLKTNYGSRDNEPNCN